MTGWLFKEIRHYWYVWLSAVLIPFVMTWLGVFAMMASSSKTHPTLETGFRNLHDAPVFSVLLTLIGYLIFGLLLQSLFSGDEIKKWGYFVCTTPDGQRRFVYMKYVTVFMLCGIYLVSVYLADSSMMTVSYMAYGIEQVSSFSLATILFFVQLLLLAIDLPGIVRFGAMAGVKLKVYAFVALIAVGFIWFLFGPLPESAEEIFGKIEDFISNLKAGTYSREMQLGVSLLMPVSLLGYLLSYRLAGGLYLKGVEGYEK